MHVLKTLSKRVIESKLNSIIDNSYSQWGEPCGANGEIDANTSNICYHNPNDLFTTQCMILINALNYQGSIHLNGYWTLPRYKTSC
jgi:hypothetical protein